jgi:hypothetical protein
MTELRTQLIKNDACEAKGLFCAVCLELHDGGYLTPHHLYGTGQLGSPIILDSSIKH